ncbi:DUF1707 SHOCT-like domain-containing protein [Pseudonocardia cypriaca]|uniref:DUF1707 SHOCT-like domain-containing protein n=1 Tax=Pseudonocardia cypriaca TaxID=882449 RepID=UPI001476AAC5|nr:DUF1707 domain-containing protein [Pseudonocardia cypriaca]
MSELTDGPSREPVRPEDMRISDVERREVQNRLQRAHDIGQLDLGEFDDRVRSVWSARTRGELARVTADLPAPPPEPGRRQVFSDTGGGIAMRVLTIVWGSLAAVNLVVWGLLELTMDWSLHPWWIWVAVPPGIALAVLYIAGIGRPPRDR